MTSAPLSDILCFLLDMDGTFFLGDSLFSFSARFLSTLSALGKDFLFLTNNSSKHRGLYAQKITRMGIPLHEEKVLTSGEATALHLRRTHPGAKLYILGTPSLEDEFRAHGFLPDNQHPDLLVLGFDTTLTYEKIWKFCDFVRAGLPYIATHPDINCPTETGFMPDIGSMIAMIKSSTGREPDEIIGKPNRLIVDAASHKLGIPINKMAMIGDRLYTDIALGKTTGITTVLVLSGETTLEDLKGSPFQPTYIFQDLGAVADYLLGK